MLFNVINPLLFHSLPDRKLLEGVKHFFWGKVRGPKYSSVLRHFFKLHFKWECDLFPGNLCMECIFPGMCAPSKYTLRYWNTWLWLAWNKISVQGCVLQEWSVGVGGKGEGNVLVYLVFLMFIPLSFHLLSRFALVFFCFFLPLFFIAQVVLEMSRTLCRM